MGCATVPPKNAFLHTFLYYYKKIKKTKNVFIFSVFSFLKIFYIGKIKVAQVAHFPNTP
jgi:hypothetical protein